MLIKYKIEYLKKKTMLLSKSSLSIHTHILYISTSFAEIMREVLRDKQLAMQQEHDNNLKELEKRYIVHNMYVL